MPAPTDPKKPKRSRRPSSSRRKPVVPDLPDVPVTLSPPSEEGNHYGARSLVLGTLSVLCLGPLAGIPAVVYGVKGRNAAARNEATNEARAVTGLLLGALGSILWVLVLGFYVSGPDETVTATPPAAESAVEQDAPAYEYEEVYPDETHTVVYEVTGSAEAWYLNHNGEGDRYFSEDGVTLPWRKEVTMTGDPSEMYYGVTASLEHGGEISCKLYEDGVLIDEEYDEGPEANVSCNGGPDYY